LASGAGLQSVRLQKNENGSNSRQSKKLNICGRKCRKKLSSGGKKHCLRPRN
jgi:hypothetical protein